MFLGLFFIYLVILCEVCIIFWLNFSLFLLTVSVCEADEHNTTMKTNFWAMDQIVYETKRMYTKANNFNYLAQNISMLKCDVAWSNHPITNSTVWKMGFIKGHTKSNDGSR